MKMTVQEIVLARRMMRESGDMTPDGKPVLREFTGKELSAFNWFVKNTKDVLDKYDEFLKTVKDKHEDKYKKEKDEETQAIANLRKVLADMDKKDKDKKEKKQPLDQEDIKMKAAFTQVQSFLQRASVDFKINQELQKDDELNKAFMENEHDVELRPATIDLMKKVIEDSKFTADDVALSNLIEKING